MTRIAPYAVPLCLFSAACSAVDSSRTGGGGSNNDATYQTFASEAAVTSTLGGVALKLSENPDRVTVSSSSGQLRHDTGATRIDDGTYALNDPDGFDQNGLLTDGFSALISTPAQGFSSNYDYARVYNQGYVTGGVAYSVTGVTGIVTQSSDMPSSGSAAYSGEAEGKFTDANGSYDLDNGTSSVTANFSTGTVSVRMAGFVAVNRASRGSANVGFDTVEINGMSISGNSFSGGTMITQNGTTTVNVVGTRQQQDTRARFFGLTTDGDPDEVGGIGYLRGDDGAVTTIFLAD